MPATYSVVPTVSTGDWITAGWVNTYIGTNLAANWPGLAAGDIEYYLSSVEKARLAKPSVNSILKNDSAGVPSWLALTSLLPGTTAGDMDYYTAAATLARIAIGANGALLRSTGSAPAWLAIGTSGYHLAVSGGVPVWEAVPRFFPNLLNLNTPLQTGDNASRFRIPAYMNGWNISSVAMSRGSGTGVLTVQIRNVSTGLDVLSTKLTIDTGETDTLTAAVAAVINTANDGVTTGQQIAIDVDDAGTNTMYAFVEVGLLKP